MVADVFMVVVLNEKWVELTRGGEGSGWIRNQFVKLIAGNSKSKITCMNCRIGVVN
jgi:hypothetical protein